MIHTAPIDTEYIKNIDVLMESEDYLNKNGYNTDLVGYHSVVNHKPDADDSGYIIKVVETTVVPFQEADVVADSTEIAICSCASYRYGKGVDDLEDSDRLDVTPCKHCEAFNKSLKAANDESQEELL